MEIKEVFSEYPRVCKVCHNNDEVILSCSPLANCQTFSLGRAGCIGHFSPEEVLEFLKLVQKTVRKTQCVIDLLELDNHSVMSRLEPYIEWKEFIKYGNSNTGHSMILYLINFKDLTHLPNAVKLI